MILIPIGHEQSAVRRLPWITFGLVAACLLAFVLSGGAASESARERAIEREVQEAMEYYLLHPYLELDPDFAELTGMQTGGVRLQSLMEALKQARQLPDVEARHVEQQHLDRLVADALDSYRSHPHVNFGLVPADFNLFALLTHMFMHAGWLHLFGNMLILYLAGPYIEDVWGRPLFLSFYVASGLSAALLFVAMHPRAEVPLVGASGAISGVMGAFLVRYWSTRIRFFYLVGFLFRGTFSAPAWVILPLWLGHQLFMAGLSSNLDESGGGVAYWAHIGGFALGVATAWVIRSKRIEERWIHPVIEQKVHETVLENAVVDQALALHARGDHEEALGSLSEELRRRPSNREAALALWEIQLNLGCPQRGAAAMVRVIQHELRSGDEDAASRHWEELSRYVPDVHVEPAVCVRLAQVLAEQGRGEDSAIVLRRALLGSGSNPDPATALQIARLGRQVDARVALGASRSALARPDLDPTTRAELEEIVSRLGPALRSSAWSGGDSGGIRG